MENLDLELDYIAAREASINVDIDRIKVDIATTAKRHGFDMLTFTVYWPSYELGEEPSVTFEGSLFG
jgi:hypothetical protein